MLHSSFRNSYKGRVFTIRFHNHQKGFTAVLEIDGLASVEDIDQVWIDKNDAKADVSNIACRIIENLQLYQSS